MVDVWGDVLRLPHCTTPTDENNLSRRKSKKMLQNFTRYACIWVRYIWPGLLYVMKKWYCHKAINNSIKKAQARASVRLCSRVLQPRLTMAVQHLTFSNNYWWSSVLPYIVLFPAGVFSPLCVSPKWGQHTPDGGNCSNRIRTLVAMSTYSCHWLTMGKVEISNYCNLTVVILTKFYRNVSWVVFYQNMNFVQTADINWLPWQPKG